MVNLGSGVLPIARDTGRVCMVWRSRHVHVGNCWGTVGGNMLPGQSAAECAVREMREEIGYDGPIELRPAYVFEERQRRYVNFIGIVPSEFSFRPGGEHAWETLFLRWDDLRLWQAMLRSTPFSFHPGVTRLFEASGEMILAAVQMCRPVSLAATKAQPSSSTRCTSTS